MKKLHVSVTDEISERLDEWVKMANEGFDDGRVTHSDCVEHILARGKPDFELLRRKKTHYGKVLARIAKAGPKNLEEVIEQLQSYRELTERSERKATLKAKSATEDSK